MLVLKILKLFGLDIPAKMEAVKTSLERRVDQTTDHVKKVAQEAAVIAALSAFASLTGMMAAGLGLVALYWLTADTYGPYAGLGTVAGILVVLTIILATAAAMKAKSLAPNETVARNALRAASDSGAGTAASVAGSEPIKPPATPAAPIASASDLAEPLALLLPRALKYPTIDNPVVDEVVGELRAAARGAADDAVNRAANVIRHGDRADLVLILAGAAFLGWLLSHHSRSLKSQ
jgi:hypothetical protein